MSFSIDEKWSMFLGTLENNAHSQLRDAHRAMMYDLHANRLPEREVMRRVEAGTYGPDAQRMWHAFRTTG